MICFPLGVWTWGNYSYGKDSTSLKCNSVPKYKSKSVIGNCIFTIYQGSCGKSQDNPDRKGLLMRSQSTSGRLLRAVCTPILKTSVGNTFHCLTAFIDKKFTLQPNLLLFLFMAVTSCHPIVHCEEPGSIFPIAFPCLPGATASPPVPLKLFSRLNKLSFLSLSPHDKRSNPLITLWSSSKFTLVYQYLPTLYQGPFQQCFSRVTAQQIGDCFFSDAGLCICPEFLEVYVGPFLQPM